LLKNITDRAHGSFQNILIPNDNPLPNLMVGVCLVLALAVNLRRPGRKLVPPLIIKVKYGALLVALMFPIDFFLFCACG